MWYAFLPEYIYFSPFVDALCEHGSNVYNDDHCDASSFFLECVTNCYNHFSCILRRLIRMRSGAPPF